VQKNHQIRVIKRDREAGLKQIDEVSGARSVAPPSERELKAVVAGWVREHRERSEDCRRALAVLFAGDELRPMRAA
jgi:hypothetical protein